MAQWHLVTPAWMEMRSGIRALPTPPAPVMTRRLEGASQQGASSGKSWFFLSRESLQPVPWGWDTVTQPLAARPVVTLIPDRCGMVAAGSDMDPKSDLHEKERELVPLPSHCSKSRQDHHQQLLKPLSQGQAALP